MLRAFLVSSSDLDFRLYTPRTPPPSPFGFGLFYLFLEICCDDVRYGGMNACPSESEVKTHFLH